MPLTLNRVHHEDCLAGLDRLEPGSVDLVFADPPFNIGYQYDVYDDRRGAPEYLAWCRQWIDGVRRCLRPDGTFWLAIGDEYAAELKVLAGEAGFVCRSWVVWYYTFGVNCVRGFSRSHTHLFHFVCDPDQFTFNESNPRVRVPSARQLVYADQRANPRGRLPDNTWIIRPQDAPHSFRPDDDTWYFARVAGTFRERQGFHGCQMPEQLLGRIIRVSSNAQDLVVDPFAGSGTTLAVAKKLGRRWSGFELSGDYVNYIKQRLNGVQPGDPLDGPEDPLRSAPRTARGRQRQPASRDPVLDEGVIAAWSEVSQGQSADQVLCDPDLNHQFVEQCRNRQLPGHAALWNKTVLRLRKSRRLPRSTVRPPRLLFSRMDRWSFAAEIAWHLLATDYQETLDNILCTPEYVAEFDRMAAEYAPGFSPHDYRWAALAIRKRSGTQKSRQLAGDKYGHWISERLPRPLELSRVASGDHDVPGVYVLRSEWGPLYVGETRNVAARIRQVLEVPAWQELNPVSATVIPVEDSDRHGLQATLVERLNPVLNCGQLRADVPGRRKPPALANRAR